MRDVHPAACTECCKRHIDSRRTMPEPLEDAGYMVHQAVLFVLYLIGAVLASPMLITAWLFGSQNRQQTDAASDASGPNIKYSDLNDEWLTHSEMQILHEQKCQLKALEAAFASASTPQQRQHITREIGTLQQMHSDYAKLLQSRSFEWQKRRDEMHRIAAEIDAITGRLAAGIASDGEIRRLAHLEDRLAQVMYEARMI